MKKLAIYGAGSFGREILPLAQAQMAARWGRQASADDVVFVSDVEAAIGSAIKGVRVLSYRELCALGVEHYEIVISLADCRTRRALAEKCEADGFSFGSLLSDRRGGHEIADIGAGAVLCDFSVMTDNLKIGRHFHCNISSYVAHDCVVGDYVTLSPHVFCGGYVVLEDEVFVGAGASIRPGSAGKPMVIGRGAIIGMGAVVTNPVAAGQTVVGNPARPL